MLFDLPLEVHEAPEPTNLKWENLGTSYKTINKNKLIALILITIFLCLAFGLFTYLKQFIVSSIKKYPPSLKCHQYEKMEETVFRQIAGFDKEATLQGKGYGMYQCYCAKNSGSLLASIESDDLCYTYHRDQED